MHNKADSCGVDPLLTWGGFVSCFFPSSCLFFLSICVCSKIICDSHWTEREEAGWAGVILPEILCRTSWWTVELLPMEHLSAADRNPFWLEVGQGWVWLSLALQEGQRESRAVLGQCSSRSMTAALVTSTQSSISWAGAAAEERRTILKFSFYLARESQNLQVKNKITKSLNIINF